MLPGTPPPWCIAHRGYSALFPENSFSAFDAALAHGAQAIELDVRPTWEGIPVVYHDAGLEKVGGEAKWVASQTLEELQQLDYGAWYAPRFRGQPLPLLDEVLGRYGRRCYLLIEVKADEGSGNLTTREALIAATLDAIKKQGLVQRAFVLCFDLALLAYGYRHNPEALFVLNQRQGCLQERADFLYAYSVYIGGLEADFARTVKARGKPVFTFTCNSQEQFVKAMECGANGIMADDPILLTERIAQVRPKKKGPRERGPFSI